MWANVAPTEYVSSFTFTQKKPEGKSFYSGDKRFKSHNNNNSGSYFANSTAVPSSFRLNNPYHKVKKPAPEEIPKGRPLWLEELRKEVPAATQYDLE